EPTLGHLQLRLLRGACPRAARSADPWARNDTSTRNDASSGCHCEKGSDEAISTRGPIMGVIGLVPATSKRVRRPAAPMRVTSADAPDKPQPIRRFCCRFA